MAAAKRPTYKGLITFPEKYTRTFEQFQKEFENVWVFTEMEEKVRLREMKKAFDIATRKPTEADSAKEQK